jgi:hypothetical protein
MPGDGAMLVVAVFGIKNDCRAAVATWQLWQLCGLVVLFWGFAYAVDKLFFKIARFCNSTRFVSGIYCWYGCSSCEKHEPFLAFFKTVKFF